MAVHEETWEAQVKGTKIAIVKDGGEVIAEVNVEDRARAKLIAAAPSMARFLRALYAEHGDNRSTFDWAYWATELETELVKAGVQVE